MKRSAWAAGGRQEQPHRQEQARRQAGRQGRSGGAQVEAGRMCDGEEGYRRAGKGEEKVRRRRRLRMGLVWWVAQGTRGAGGASVSRRRPTGRAESRPLSRIVVTTSVSRTTPCTARLETALDSLAWLDAPARIVADALPTWADVAALKAVDADKWRAQWAETSERYEEYLRRVETLASVRGCEFARAERFGHLSGSVRLGLRGLQDQDWVLITQHDLALRSPLELPTHQIGAALADASNPVQYVLLHRDDPDSPRSRDWFFPEDCCCVEHFTGNQHGALELIDLGGGFSDQAHFANVGWYRSEVLARCPTPTCMEHVCHRRLQPGATAALPGRNLIDLDHGSMIRTTALPFTPKWESSHFFRAACGSPSPTVSDWSVLHYDRRGRPRGATNHARGDAARPADLFATVLVDPS